MGLIQRFRDAFTGPTKADLEARIAYLAERERKFPRRNKPIASGVEMGWGDYEYEFNTQLQGAKRFETLEKMEADPHVKSSLMNSALPLLTAEWEITPASDDERDIEIAEFCEANLLRKSSDRFGRDYWLQTSWTAQRLPEILTMMRDGFACFVTTKKRVGTKVVFDRLQWIEPRTIDGTTPWELTEEDEIIAINRQLTTPGQNFLYDERIEAERLKLYVWDLHGARYEGRSFIRSMYGAWMRKEFILRQAAIWAQKVGAPIPIGYYPDSFTPTDRARFEQLVKAARGSSPAEAFGMFPEAADGRKAELKYVGAETGEVDRMRGLIDGENKEISHAGGNTTSMLGETQTGSRALGDTKGKKEIKFTQALGEIVGEWETHGVGNIKGTIQELVDDNYAGVESYPRLTCTKIDPFENFGEVLEAWKAGIIPKHEDARRQIVEGTLGLSLPDDAYEIEDIAPPTPFGAPGDGPPGTDPSSPPDQPAGDPPPGAADLEAAEDFRARIAPLLEPMEDAPKGGNFRARTRLEFEVCDLAAIGETFRVGERDALIVLREARQRMKVQLMRSLPKVTERSLGTQRRAKFRGAGVASARMLDRLTETALDGAGHVVNELQRQDVAEDAA